jgi:NAD+ kinase
MVNDRPNPLGSELIGIVLHPTRAVDETVARIESWTQDHQIGVVGRHRDDARLPRSWQRLDDTEFASHVGAVMSIGGDGTMLGAMRLVASRPVPVLGVNYGNVGFLVEIQPPELDAALAQLAAGRYAIEPHNALDVEVTRADDGADQALLAFNDTVITRIPGHGVVAPEFTLRGSTFGYSKSDGVICCPPAGSTAYNYSAGGPIVSPGVDAIIVTPVAPMAGISRPVVLSPDDQFSLTLTAPSRQAALELDGNLVMPLHQGDKVAFAYRPQAGLVIRLNRRRHVASGLVKLGLRDVPLSRSQLNELFPDDLAGPRRLDPASSIGEPTVGWDDQH